MKLSMYNACTVIAELMAVYLSMDWLSSDRMLHLICAATSFAESV